MRVALAFLASIVAVEADAEVVSSKNVYKCALESSDFKLSYKPGTEIIVGVFMDSITYINPSGIGYTCKPSKTDGTCKVEGDWAVRFSEAGKKFYRELALYDSTGRHADNKTEEYVCQPIQLNVT